MVGKERKELFNDELGFVKHSTVHHLLIGILCKLWPISHFYKEKIPFIKKWSSFKSNTRLWEI